MSSRARSFTFATAAVFAVLFFGGPAEKADARESPRVTAERRHDGSNRQFRRGPAERDRMFSRRFDNRSFERRVPRRFDNRVFVRPFRTVRVFVYDPFPHWVLRRIYDDATVVVGPDCDRY
jgi:hypothetical protein